MPKERFYTFLADGVTITSRVAAVLKNIYAPLCGPDAAGLKSAITPSLGGDIKTDKFHYLTKPASREDLRQPCREFYVYTAGRLFSLTRETAPDSAIIEVGQLWHKLARRHKSAGLELTAVNFIPSAGETLELMAVTVKNISRKSVKFTPTAAIPIFGRSLANKHDHEHVTALLNRVTQNPDGVLVKPTMAFNEEGHTQAGHVYFVYGIDDKGNSAQGSFPTVDAFFGDGGDWGAPQAVVENRAPKRLSEIERHGKEAMGGLRFKDQTLKPGQSKTYVIAIGMAADAQDAAGMFGRFNSPAKFEAALKANQEFWSQKISTIQIRSGDARFDAWMRWVTLQPLLRRIFGCSFLPDHDYGKGGKGWRDLWQDLLSLILIEPKSVRQGLIDNCAGIRIDGSNATIIGTKPGEFIADRNAITRVWMDHGCWPFLTFLLYIHQTGDFDILLQSQTYFRDPQTCRGTQKDLDWMSRPVYEGTVLEHVLVQNVAQFFNVGEHNIIRLESADWNDGLDMAFDRGESVAFTAFYGGNLLRLADLLEEMGRRKNITSLRLAKEVLVLLDTLTNKPLDYDDAAGKKAHLFETYFATVQPVLSGEQVDVSISGAANDLRQKGKWIFQHLRRQEKLDVNVKGKKYQWFNGYYDNRGKRVEGGGEKDVRMTLTGQVFSIMSGMTNKEETQQVINSVEHFLRDHGRSHRGKKLGGYRLNTDFGLDHYLDLGRAFSFAYGSKENGSFFSHMNVMYAYALYSRGFAREGFSVLDSIYRMASDGKTSKIYPGVPEYFDSQGQGMYHYLTGSASWLVLTQLTQVFGVRGHYGNLVLAPNLVKEQFGRGGKAAVTCHFAGHKLTVEYHNPRQLRAGKYHIKEVKINNKSVRFDRRREGGVVIDKKDLAGAAVVNVLLDVL